MTPENELLSRRKVIPGPGVLVSGLPLSMEDYSLLHHRKVTANENRKLESSIFDFGEKMIAQLIGEREKKR